MSGLLAEDRLPGAGAEARVAVTQAGKELLAVLRVRQPLVVAESEDPEGGKERKQVHHVRCLAGKGQREHNMRREERKGGCVICQEIILVSVLLPHIGICIGVTWG